jgi:nitrogen regulatory protein P-II 1
MRKIEAVIRKLKFKDVKINLINAGFDTFTYWAVRSVGESSERNDYKAKGDDAVANERIKLNLLVREEREEEAVNIIVDSGKTIEVDDSQITVLTVNKVYKIRGQEAGDKKILKF